MNEPPRQQLNIHIGIIDNEMLEYAKSGSAILNIPYYKVKVNLTGGISKNITPTFKCSITDIDCVDSKPEEDYIQLSTIIPSLSKGERE